VGSSLLGRYTAYTSDRRFKETVREELTGADEGIAFREVASDYLPEDAG
jgi:hypothetical protein